MGTGRVASLAGILLRHVRFVRLIASSDSRNSCLLSTIYSYEDFGLSWRTLYGFQHNLSWNENLLYNM
jgi:hypothetical protein